MDADERLRSFCGAIDRPSAHHTFPLESGLFEIEQDGKAEASYGKIAESSASSIRLIANYANGRRRKDLNICVHLRYLR